MLKNKCIQNLQRFVVFRPNFNFVTQTVKLMDNLKRVNIKNTNDYVKFNKKGRIKH